MPTTVTVQQLQQIVKNVAGGGQGSTVQIGSVTGAPGQQFSHTVLAKAGGVPGQTMQTRVIPVSATGGRGQQTIQVLAAGPHVQRAGTAVPNVTLDALSRQQGGTASAIASALAAGNPVKIAASGGATQQQILSQVTAALAGQTGQPVSVAVRNPPIAVSSGVMSSQLTARTINTSVGGHQILATSAGHQQPTTLVVNQPQHQLSVPQHHQLVSTQQQPQTVQHLSSIGNQQQIAHNQIVVTNSQQQQQLMSSQPQLVPTQQQHQLVTSQQLLQNQQQQQLASLGVAKIPHQQQSQPNTTQIVGTGQQGQQQLVVNQPQQQIGSSQQQLVSGGGPPVGLHQINPNSQIQSSESS